MIKPLQNYVLLEKVQEEVKTHSGIILSEKPKDEPCKGTVVAVGPGKVENGVRIEVGLHGGEVVIYKKFAGSEVSYEGKKYLLLASEDILAIIE